MFASYKTHRRGAPPHHLARQRGASLLEAALTVVLVSGIFMGMAPLMVKNQEAMRAKSIAQDYTQFSTAAAAHFESNRSAYISAMTDGTGADSLCKVGVDPLSGDGGHLTYDALVHRCALDVPMLKHLAAMPESATETNAYGARWVAIFKLVFDQQTPAQPTGAVEMLVVSASVNSLDPLPPPEIADTAVYERALTAAGFAAGNGGVIPDADRSTCVASRQAGKFEACGSGWRVSLADYLATDELQVFANRLSD